MLHLFCLPFAGGSAAATYGRWPRLLPREVRVLPLELAGHGRRGAEPLCDSVKQSVADLLRAIAPAARSAPYALFGHSMGTLIAYELVRALDAAGLPPPRGLFMSGRKPPHHACAQREMHLLGDDLFLAEIRKLGGTPDAFFGSEALMAAFLPVLRSDYRMMARYEAQQPVHVTSAPLTVLCGDRDPLADAHSLRTWQAYTSGDFRIASFSGGHFFLHDHAARICALIAQQLQADLPLPA